LVTIIAIIASSLVAIIAINTLVAIIAIIASSLVAIIAINSS